MRYNKIGMITTKLLILSAAFMAVNIGKPKGRPEGSYYNKVKLKYS